MSVRVYCWQAGRAWLATCPTLQSGGRGETRDAALRELRSEIRAELETVFAEGIQVINSPPPLEE
jgi:hypothetical protein